MEVDFIVSSSVRNSVIPKREGDMRRGDAVVSLRVMVGIKRVLYPFQVPVQNEGVLVGVYGGRSRLDLKEAKP